MGPRMEEAELCKGVEEKDVKTASEEAGKVEEV